MQTQVDGAERRRQARALARNAYGTRRAVDLPSTNCRSASLQAVRLSCAGISRPHPSSGLRVRTRFY